MAAYDKSESKEGKQPHGLGEKKKKRAKIRRGGDKGESIALRDGEGRLRTVQKRNSWGKR